MGLIQTSLAKKDNFLFSVTFDLSQIFWFLKKINLNEKSASLLLSLYYICSNVNETLFFGFFGCGYNDE